jgi:hypothetical protein
MVNHYNGKNVKAPGMRAAERERDGAGGCSMGWAGPCLQNKQIRVGPRIEFLLL